MYRIKKTTTKVVDHLQAIDQFGSYFTMKFEGKQYLKSYLGAILSVVLGFITLGFIITKYNVVVHKQSAQVMSSVEENGIDFNTKFTSENGLFIAVAITEYSQDEERIEEAKYGELRIEHYGWGNTQARELDPNGLIQNHWCTDEELGINRTSDTVMYPLREQQQAELLTYRKKFKCIDKDQLSIWGDFNSLKAQ